MNLQPTIPDRLDLIGWRLDPDWSRFIEVDSHDGNTYRWHLLDTGVVDPVATIVCVHGNPTWSYSWHKFLAGFDRRFRIVAIDQLGMGWSQRTDRRRFADRVRDLNDVIEYLQAEQPLGSLYLAAHDWGGAIAMGWAVHHRQALADRGVATGGMVLCNTGIAVPDGRGAPTLIRLAASAPLRDLVCRRSRAFIEGTLALSGARLSPTDRTALRAPYRDPAARVAIADFVADIPFDDDHSSARAIAEVADRLGEIDIPVMIAWGASDPVFNDDFGSDLASRFTDVVTQRYRRAGHLVMLETDLATTARRWVEDHFEPQVPTPLTAATREPTTATAATTAQLTAELWDFTAADFARRQEIAVLDVATDDSLTYEQFGLRVNRAARALVAAGVQAGDRVAVLVPPGVDLLVAVYALWRVGGVTVIADRGLGITALGQAIKGARVAWILGNRQTRVAARTLRWAPNAAHLDLTSLDAVPIEAGEAEVSEAAGTADAAGTAITLPPEPGPAQIAAVLFTSGATGPAKGVVYRFGQLVEQVEALRRTYSITPADRFVAAFAPFALYGPALGIGVAFPDGDITAPRQLTADALGEAIDKLQATLVFASPAALGNVVKTSNATKWEGVRLVLSAGAPVPISTLTALTGSFPNATFATPYGMTEALPIASITLRELLDQPARDGVCVGSPVAGADVIIVKVGDEDRAAAGHDRSPNQILTVGQTGEILVRSPWVSEGYFGLWATEHSARPTVEGKVWHRTGDVGHLAADGRLWIEGRAAHLIYTLDGAVTPLPIERAIRDQRPVTAVAAVGVGPKGLQQLVIVIEDPDHPDGLAPLSTSTDIRQLVTESNGITPAAVMTLKALPRDVRHDAKINRLSIAEWAERLLAGKRARRPRR